MVWPCSSLTPAPRVPHPLQPVPDTMSNTALPPCHLYLCCTTCSHPPELHRQTPRRSPPLFDPLNQSETKQSLHNPMVQGNMMD